VKEKSEFEHLINDEYGRFSPEGFEAYIRISATEPRVLFRSVKILFLPVKKTLIKQTTFGHIKYYNKTWLEKGAYVKAETVDGEQVKIFSDVETIRSLISWAHSQQKTNNIGF